MKKYLFAALTLLLYSLTACSLSNLNTDQITMSTVSGIFEVKLTPQDDSEPAGRMSIVKSYSGGMVGSGVGQMISKRTEEGTAIYFAIEEFTGSIDDKSGAFTLVHQGEMTADSQFLMVKILEGSGSDDFASITGSLEITQTDGSHSYQLDYSL